MENEENEGGLGQNSENDSFLHGGNDQGLDGNDAENDDAGPVGEADDERRETIVVSRIRIVSFAADKVASELRASEDFVADNESEGAQLTDNVEPGRESESAWSGDGEGEDGTIKELEKEEGEGLEKAEEGSEKVFDKIEKEEEGAQEGLEKEEGSSEKFQSEKEDAEVAELSDWDVASNLTGRHQEDGLPGTMNTPTLLTDSELETPVQSPVKMDSRLSGAMTTPTTVTELEFDTPRQSPAKLEPFRPGNMINWPYNVANVDNNVDACLPPLAGSGKKPAIQLHEWSYHRTSRYLRNPFYTPVTTCPKMCCEPSQWLTTSRYSGPDRRKNTVERHWERNFCLEDRRVSEALLRPNPAVAIPMRARKWKKMTWVDPTKDVEQWKVMAERDKAKKDRRTAQKLGYETLVGNIMYYDIPGAKDLNRSWKHFLDPDPMSWGFPYHKGSLERPCLPHPSPYLVHQMKEQLWKYPRNKLIAHSTPPPSVPTPSGTLLN